MSTQRLQQWSMRYTPLLFHNTVCLNWPNTWQWTAIISWTGIQGFYVAVRGSVEDYHEPKVFFSDRTMKFVKEILGIEPKQLALKLEAWCVSGLGKKGWKYHPLNMSNWPWHEKTRVLPTHIIQNASRWSAIVGSLSRMASVSCKLIVWNSSTAHDQ